jgi:hypothetical protein
MREIKEGVAREDTPTISHEKSGAPWDFFLGAPRSLTKHYLLNLDCIMKFAL